MEGVSPHCIIIFGSTGDLAKKKLLPALKNLIVDRGCSFPVVCCGRKKLTRDEYFDYIEISKEEQSFIEKIDYFHLDFQKPDLKKFRELLKDLDKKYKFKGHYIFYFSLPSNVFSDAIKFIKNSEINKNNSNVKLAFEKPFGADLNSAKELHKTIRTAFLDEQVFLVDHFLGIDFIQNVLILRCTNPMLDQIWNSHHIDHILITFAEKLGVEGRGSFYEKTGVIRDVVQNHILQLVSLIGIDCPENLTPLAFTKKKAVFFENLQPVDKKDIIIGQYRSGKIEDEKVKGYREEEEVKQNSETETFINFRFYVDHPQWRGVPWYIKAGKRLNEDQMDIQIYLKKTGKLIENQNSTQIHLKEKPKTEISISFNTKVAGKKDKLQLQVIKNCFSYKNDVNSPGAYESIIVDIMKNDHTLFIGWEELFQSWKFADDLIAKANALKPSELHFYAAGTNGPEVNLRRL